MKKIITGSLFILIFSFSYSQIDRLHLYKLPDKQNKRTIKKGAYLTLSVRYYDKDSLRIEDQFEGYFLETRGDSILLDLQRKSKYINLEEGMLEHRVLSKGFDTKPFPYIEEAISFDGISMITYRSKPAKVFRKIGTITFWASAATVLLVAPLASINYSKGTFDFDRYKTIVLAGGIGITVSIPMLLLSGRKKALMKEGLQHIDKSVWTF